MTSHKKIYAHKSVKLISDAVDFECQSLALNGNPILSTDSDALLAAPITGAFLDPAATLTVHRSGPLVSIGFQGQSVAIVANLTALFAVGTLPAEYRPLQSTHGIMSGVAAGLLATLQWIVQSDGSIEIGNQNASATGVPLPFAISGAANGWARFSISYLNNIAP